MEGNNPVTRKERRARASGVIFQKENARNRDMNNCNLFIKLLARRVIKLMAQGLESRLLCEGQDYAR